MQMHSFFNRQFEISTMFRHSKLFLHEGVVYTIRERYLYDINKRRGKAIL